MPTATYPAAFMDSALPAPAAAAAGTAKSVTARSVAAASASLAAVASQRSVGAGAAASDAATANRLSAAPPVHSHAAEGHQSDRDVSCVPALTIPQTPLPRAVFSAAHSSPAAAPTPRTTTPRTPTAATSSLLPAASAATGNVQAHAARRAPSVARPPARAGNSSSSDESSSADDALIPAQPSRMFASHVSFRSIGSHRSAATHATGGGLSALRLGAASGVTSSVRFTPLGKVQRSSRRHALHRELEDEAGLDAEASRAWSAQPSHIWSDRLGPKGKPAPSTASSHRLASDFALMADWPA